MTYVSTRGQAPVLAFEDVLLTGLARDGGLYVPTAWPRLQADDFAQFKDMSYAEVAVRVITPFLDGALSEAAFADIVDRAYSRFDGGEVAPVRQLDDDRWLMELFHGPTLAFKDVAMQLLALLFDAALRRRGERVTIVGATSGDTGSAAIEACRGRDAVTVFMLHPKDRVSEVQRRQMTTVLAPNIHNIAIEGTFDDCQNLLKAMFNDLAFRDALSLSAVNSINWARVMAQIVYYVTAASQLASEARPATFCVPTGNFGDVYAGYAAAAMGAPIAKLIVATNRNDILHRFFNTGEYRTGEVHQTQSPSMDIQLASNFERLLFDLCERDGARVERYMTALAETGRFTVDEGMLARARELFDSACIEEAETTATIERYWKRHGVIVDPHTAVGLAAADEYTADGGPLITLATAHAAKFPQAVVRATGEEPALPARLADLYQRPERYTVLPNDLEAVENHIRNASE